MDSDYDPFEIRQYPISLPEKKLKRGEEKKQQRITMAAGAMIFAHNKVLLDRSETSDLWSIPGGAVKFNEGPAETVVREVKEELNLSLKVLQKSPYVYHFVMESDEYIDLIFLLHFLVKVDGGTKVVMGNDVVDYRWESIGSHFRDCYPNVKAAVDHFMDL